VLFEDRLYTDIKMGIDANITTCYVLSGKTTLKMIKESECRPDFIINGIWEFYYVIK
jgi:ribonucleotide monophosphatase NagD (HAD superfamily)